MPKKRATISIRRRKRLRIRDGDLCCWCHEPMDFECEPNHPRYATIEHIIERRCGGSNDDANLALAHRNCNILRSRGAPKPGPLPTLAD